MQPSRRSGDEMPLPELRPDLQVAHAEERSGYVIFDPMRQSYFRIDDVTARLLALWPRHRSVAELSDAASARMSQPVGIDQVAALSTFLVSNQLATAREPRAWLRLAQIEKQRQGTVQSWLVHNYLFVKIPLVNPQQALLRWTPRLAFLFTRWAAMAIASFGLLGLYLTARQWSEFWSTFSDFASLQGMMTFVVAMAFVKSLHELGHAVTASRFGCRVPSMGLCFMILVPMLYTDVSDAWRLTSRRKRLAIDSAGLLVELSIACVALFLWAFLPEGGLKSIAFALATTSLALSIALNLNPFMRFDGYYILADAVGVENLQPRAFDIGVWRMRELLFELRRPPPEPMSQRYLTALAIYAWATWVYRLVLFTAIAVLVYGIGFKLLGVALFLIEIVYFIGRPVVREMGQWFGMRKLIVARRRGLWLATGVMLVVAASFVPMSTAILVPAIIEDRDAVPLHPRRAALISAVHATSGQTLSAGAAVLTMTSPDLEHEIAQTERRIEATRWRLQRRAGSMGDRAETLVLEQTLAGLTERLAGLTRERAELHVTMPFAGVLAERGDGLHIGRWLQRRDLIAIAASNGGCRVLGYVSEDQVGRIDLQGHARFVAEDGRIGAIAVAVQAVAAAGTETLDRPELASHYGGGVAARVVTRGAEGRSLVPVVAQFRIEGRVDDPKACGMGRIERGTLHVHGRAESAMARTWRQVLKVLVRESGL